MLSSASPFPRRTDLSLAGCFPQENRQDDQEGPESQERKEEAQVAHPGADENAAWVEQVPRCRVS